MITSRQIGIVECVMGIFLLAFSIVAIVHTVNTSSTDQMSTLQTYATILGYKYNASFIPGNSGGAGIMSGFGYWNMSSLTSVERISLMSDFENYATTVQANNLSIIPVFVLAAICALALSFIMIFQGLYHWNNK